MVVTYSELGHLALCCFQTTVLFHLLVTRTLLCIPMHHTVSAYGGMISDILKVCFFVISLHFSSFEMILQNAIDLLT
jgi:hypothetical protein